MSNEPATELPQSAEPTDRSAPARKRSYQPPTLLCYGSVTELTRGPGGALPDGVGGSEGPV